MKKNTLLILFLSLALGWLHLAEAQQAGKVWKVGVLASSSPSMNQARDEALRQGLRSRGYIEGQNLIIEYKYAEGKIERLPELARELIENKVDVIVVGGTRVALTAKKATSTIPIVVAGAGDLVETGLIKSFMYPGGNVTGVARLSADFFDDRLKLIKQILPKASQINALVNPKNPGHRRSLKDAELGARSSGLAFQAVSAGTSSELDSAIGRASKGGASALLVITDAMFSSNLERIAQLALKHRLPAIYDRSAFIEAGGLLSYGANLAELSRRAAEYVDQIFKGAKPEDLTLVQPTKFDLSINLKTAQQIGVTIPPNLLARADQIIK
jgi:putative ABC transport system substrate-binding protein